MRAIDREVHLLKIASTGVAEKSVTKLTLMYEFHEGDDCDLAVYLCKICPEVRESIRLADEDDARVVKIASNAKSRIGEPWRHVVLWACPYRQRNGVPAADEKTAKLLDFPKAQIVGDLSFKIKGKGAKLYITIQIETAEMVTPDGDEIGLRTLYQLRGESMWLDMEWPEDVQEKMNLDPVADAAKKAADSVDRDEERREARTSLLSVVRAAEALEDGGLPEGEFMLGISRVTDDWAAITKILVDLGGFQPASAQEKVESVSAGNIELIASDFGAGDQWAIDLSNALEAAGAVVHFVGQGQTLEGAVSEWARANAAPSSAETAAPVPFDIRALDLKQLREMAARGDVPQIKQALIALGEDNIESLQSYYTEVTQKVSTSTKPDYIATKFLSAIKQGQALG